MGLAKSLRNQLAGRNALVLQVGRDRLGTPLRQLQVVGVAADRVAVAVDVNLDVRIGLERFGGLIQHRPVNWPNHGFVKVEMNATQNNLNRWRWRWRWRWWRRWGW